MRDLNILDEYCKGDEQRRMNLYLTYRTLRSRFDKIEQKERENRERQSLNKAHARGIKAKRPSRIIPFRFFRISCLKSKAGWRPFHEGEQSLIAAWKTGVRNRKPVVWTAYSTKGKRSCPALPGVKRSFSFLSFRSWYGIETYKMHIFLCILEFFLPRCFFTASARIFFFHGLSNFDL